MIRLVRSEWSSSFFRHLNLRYKRESWHRDRRKKLREKSQGKGKAKSVGVVER